MADPPRRYSDDEIEAIFRRAIERQQAAGEGFHRDELLAAGKEMGLDESALDRAAREVQHERNERELREAVARKQREGWLRHLVIYLVLAGGPLALHAFGLVGAWVIWMALGWGAGLAMHTFNTFKGPTEEQVEKERRKRNRRERRAAQARARAERKKQRAERRQRRAQSQQRKSQVEEELEAVIEEGVSMLLGAAARKIREASDRAEQQRRAQGDFGRYVERKRSGRAAPTAAPRPERPQVRVAEEGADAEDDEVGVEAERKRRRGRR
ncbi:MAG TPA: 2TM domain-containing protein [Sandaracinaceae bacterium LLY-WYZ-13_1]|nr:2TM domain-containing protein [Sandaracinaceae bacterium LLY-WYZ-13_1]